MTAAMNLVARYSETRFCNTALPGFFLFLSYLFTISFIVGNMKMTENRNKRERITCKPTCKPLFRNLSFLLGIPQLATTVARNSFQT